MADGLKISQLNPATFEAAKEAHAQIPVAFGNTSNARVDAYSVASYMEYLARILTDGKAEAEDLQALVERVTEIREILTQETTDRQNADNNLQTQIDAKQDKVSNAVHCIDATRPNDTLYWYLGKLKDVHSGADLLKIEYILGNKDSWTNLNKCKFATIILSRYNEIWKDASFFTACEEYLNPDEITTIRCMWTIHLTSDNSIYASIKGPHFQYVQAKFFIDTHDLDNTNPRPTASTTPPDNIQYTRGL
jgi:hypothetical protein